MVIYREPLSASSRERLCVLVESPYKPLGLCTECVLRSAGRFAQ